RIDPDRERRVRLHCRRDRLRKVQSTQVVEPRGGPHLRAGAGRRQRRGADATVAGAAAASLGGRRLPGLAAPAEADGLGDDRVRPRQSGPGRAGRAVRRRGGAGLGAVRPRLASAHLVKGGYMSPRSLWFLIREAFTNIWRHQLMTLASVTTVAASLSVLGGF